MNPGSSRLQCGWVVVASLTMVLTATSGARFLFGVVLKPVAEEFDWRRADLAGAVLVNMAILSVMQPAMGYVIDRFGSRRVLIFGTTLLALALVPLSRATELWQIYLIYGVIMAAGFAATSPVNTTSIVSGWFAERRGTALAIATSGSAFGQLLIVPLAAVTLERFDWPAVYRGLAIVLFAVMLPLVLIFIRESPAQRTARRVRSSPDGGETSDGGQHSSTLRDALHSRGFWILSFGFLTCGYTMAFASTHFLAYADDMGMGTLEAADVVAVTAVFSILGSVALGIAGDRYTRSGVLSLTYALRGVAFILLFWLPQGSWIYFYAIVLGISWTATTPLTAAIAADLYGPRKIGLIFGSMFTFMNLGFGAGAFLDGLAYDVTGGYSAVIVFNAALGLVAAIAVLTTDVGKSIPERLLVRRRPSPYAPEASTRV